MVASFLWQENHIEKPGLEFCSAPGLCGSADFAGTSLVFADVSFKDHLPGPYMFNYRMRFFNDLRMVEKLVLYPFNGNFRIFTWVNG